MTSRDFCFWLQGYFEVTNTGPQPPEPHGGHGLHVSQVDCIRRHLALVFKHEIDPSMGGPKEQETLDAIHAKPPAPGIPHPWPGHHDVRIRC